MRKKPGINMGNFLGQCTCISIPVGRSNSDYCLLTVYFATWRVSLICSRGGGGLATWAVGHFPMDCSDKQHIDDEWVTWYVWDAGLGYETLSASGVRSQVAIHFWFDALYIFWQIYYFNKCRVSELNFIMYAQSQKIGKWNNLNVLYLVKGALSAKIVNFCYP